MTTSDADLSFIGRIVTPYQRLEDCPRNFAAEGPPCRLILDPPYRDGLLGLAPGRSIVVLYWLGLGDRRRLRQHSRRTGEFAGVFALRTPNRPNPIGLATCSIEQVSDGILLVRGLDCLNGTPLLDIKPAINRPAPLAGTS